jgi:hypothetical protein
MFAKAKLVHFRAIVHTPRGERVHAACTPEVLVSNLSRIKLHDAPAAITCLACRETWLYRERVKWGAS